MNILELFAGTASFSNAASDHTTFTTDFDEQFDTDYTVDIMRFDTAKVPFEPDVIWASPPCETFSVASIGHHWTGGSKAYIPKTTQAVDGLARVQKTLDIIKELKPQYWYIENPRGVLRKLIPKMLDKTLGNMWVCRTVTYCQYGDTRMKPTDIWTNNLNWQPLPMCKNGMPCHIAAPRGSSTGTQGIKTYKDRSRVPEDLCREIVLSTESLTNNLARANMYVDINERITNVKTNRRASTSYLNKEKEN